VTPASRPPSISTCREADDDRRDDGEQPGTTISRMAALVEMSTQRA
jgi:hypothetical protein